MVKVSPFALLMIINADTLLPHLKEKVRPTQSDASRHLLCPECGIRTRLNTLGDGRRKCTMCGKKFRIHKVSEGNKLQQCAEILLCFCLDFSERQAAQITYHRYRLVALYYDHFRRLLTETHLSPGQWRLLSKHSGDIQVVHERSRCRWCKSKSRGADKEQPPVFGVRIGASDTVTIDPLGDDDAALHFDPLGSIHMVLGGAEDYAGFICCGKLHRSAKADGLKDNAEKLWRWIQERAHVRTGMWKRDTGFFLKELEWKYNNRSLDPDRQAQNIIGFMPADFLTTWVGKEVHSDR